MARLFVHVQLEVLVIHQEASALLVDGEVRVVSLRQEVHVVAMRELRLRLDCLVVDVGPAQRVNVRPVAVLTSFPQSRLHLRAVRLQVVVDHIEVLELGELAVWRQLPAN